MQQACAAAHQRAKPWAAAAGRRSTAAGRGSNQQGTGLPSRLSGTGSPPAPTACRSTPMKGFSRGRSMPPPAQLQPASPCMQARHTSRMDRRGRRTSPCAARLQLLSPAKHPVRGSTGELVKAGNEHEQCRFPWPQPLCLVKQEPCPSSRHLHLQQPLRRLQGRHQQRGGTVSNQEQSTQAEWGPSAGRIKRCQPLGARQPLARRAAGSAPPGETAWVPAPCRG